MPIHDWTRVDAGVFPALHHGWLSGLNRALNRGGLPHDYYALIEPAAGIQPDVLAKGPERLDPSASAGHVLNVRTTPPRVRFTATAEPEYYARKRDRIVIRRVEDDTAVAVLEIVSPGNKASRHGLRSFVDQALVLLDAGIHLLLIDLFPPGPRDPQGIHDAVWSEISDEVFRLPPDKPLTLVAYEAGLVKSAFIEPVAVGDTLPAMPLFLEPGLHVPVPLEEGYCAAFDGVPIPWREELEPPPR